MRQLKLPVVGENGNLKVEVTNYDVDPMCPVKTEYGSRYDVVNDCHDSEESQQKSEYFTPDTEIPYIKKKHSSVKPYTSYAIRHMPRLTYAKTHKCEYMGCTAEFNIPGRLREHERIHTGEFPYKCDYNGCAAEFCQSSGLSIHKQIHQSGSLNMRDNNESVPLLNLKDNMTTLNQITGEMSYKCDFSGCTAIFKQPGALKMHKQNKHKIVHTSKMIYMCDFSACTAIFNQPSALEMHKQSHEGEKPYKCDFSGCSAGFDLSWKLNSHKGIHTVERLYKCDFSGCRATFKQPRDVKKHMRIHTAVKIYKCEYSGCTAAFKLPLRLKEHEHIHTGEFPYKCDYNGCQAAFYQSCGLQSHKRMHTCEKS